MNIKKFLFIIFFAGISVFILSNILHIDKPVSYEKQANKNFVRKVEKKPPGNFKTVEIDGREYRQARGEVGKYGGEFHNSSI